MPLNTNVKQQQYKDPVGGDKSSVGSQYRTDWYDRAALVDAFDEFYFSLMSPLKDMPKHQGKAIKKYRHIRVLDDRNVNDQGIDKDGTSITNGNLYGSSDDVSTVVSSLPSITETGGRANRIGMTRLDLESEITEQGIFREWTEASYQFDTEADLYGRQATEMVRAAAELYEDYLNIDLLNGAGVVRYAGAATADDEITGEGSEVSEVDHYDFAKLNIILNKNKAPHKSKIITGSRLIDTKTVNRCRVIYIPPDMQLTLEEMQDPFGNAAFIPVRQYADAGTLINGEIGTIGSFRIVVVPRAKVWRGKGASATAANKGYQSTNGKYDVFPLLVVTGESFVTIGFHGAANGNGKFRIMTKHPGMDTFGKEDPFGKTGVQSIQWWYGTLITQPTHIGIIKSVAKL